MPGFEQQPQQEQYIPHCASIDELVERPDLTFDEEVLEVARLKYELEQETIELLKQVEKIENPKMHDTLQEIVELVALTDVPEAEKLDGIDKEKLIHVQNLIKDIKNELDV